MAVAAPAVGGGAGPGRAPDDLLKRAARLGEALWSDYEAILAGADGSGQPQQLTSVPAFYADLVFSPDGSRLVGLRGNEGFWFDIYFLPIYEIDADTMEANSFFRVMALSRRRVPASARRNSSIITGTFIVLAACMTAVAFRYWFPVPLFFVALTFACFVLAAFTATLQAAERFTFYAVTGDSVHLRWSPNTVA